MSTRFPFEAQIASLPPEIQIVHRTAWNKMESLSQANAALAKQVNAISPTASTPASSTTTISNSETVSVAPNVIGFVNNQAGVTVYATQQTDYGAFVILNDASPIAVSLSANPLIQLPWYASIINLGAGTATLTPASGLIDSGASYSLPSNTAVTVAYDGTNFWTEPVSSPANTPAVSHQWINAYIAATGVFTQAQPAFSDVSGNLTTSQLPTAWVSAIITTAQLTVGGTQGSQTFTNGVLTAQVQAT
jgi:hypothetical protein